MQVPQEKCWQEPKERCWEVPHEECWDVSYIMSYKSNHFHNYRSGATRGLLGDSQGGMQGCQGRCEEKVVQATQGRKESTGWLSAEHSRYQEKSRIGNI